MFERKLSAEALDQQWDAIYKTSQTWQAPFCFIMINIIIMTSDTQHPLYEACHLFCVTAF